MNIFFSIGFFMMPIFLEEFNTTYCYEALIQEGCVNEKKIHFHKKESYIWVGLKDINDYP